jgi:putative ABC transport system permease protein
MEGTIESFARLFISKSCRSPFADLRIVDQGWIAASGDSDVSVQHSGGGHNCVSCDMRFSTILFKNLFRRMIRSLLTLFGIAIAVGTTVSLLGIADGFRRTTYEAIAGRGVDLVVLERDAVDQLSSDLDERLLDIVLEIPGVSTVSPTLVDVAAFAAKGTTINALVQGWVPGDLTFSGLSITSGRTLEIGDQGEAIIGHLLAAQLEKQPGDMVDIEGEPFAIVGIYESFVLPENVGLVVPLKEMQRVRFNEGRVTAFGVVVDQEIRNVEEVKRRINDLKRSDGRDARLFGQTVRDYARESIHIKIALAMAWLTSAIAIIVGTIGILNTMVMSVVERVREISILRAIGWKKSRIVGMVLGESLIISTAGAIVGILAAAAMNKYLTTLPSTQGLVTGHIAWPVVLFGFGMATIVGFVGGIYPAFRAASLPPSHGLRSE